MPRKAQSKRASPVKRKSLDADLAKVFDVIYRVRNLTIAAELLNTDQSQLSRKVRTLEQIFGGELFVRAGKGVTPTPLAERLAGPISEQVDHFDNVLLRAAKFDARTTEQTFVLHIRPDVAPFLVPSLVKRVTAETPRIKLYMKARRDRLLASDLKAGNPQLAVFTEPVVDDSCFHEKLFEDRVAVIARKDHPRIKGRTISKELYGELEHIIAARSGPLDPSPFELVCRKNNIQRRIRLATPTPSVVPEIVNMTDLISTTSRRMANYFRRHFNVAVYDLPFKDVSLTYSMMWHRRFAEDESHAWLRKQILEVSREIAAAPVD